MKKLYLLFLFLVCAGYINAQQWRVYDASVKPEATAGASLNISTLQSNNPGANFVDAIIDDPSISGNKLFKFVQPDLWSVSDPGNTQARRLYVDVFNPVYKGTKLTIVARLAGLPIDSLPNANIINFEVHNKVANNREDIFITPYDSTIRLARANKTAKVNADLNKWHLYRIIVDDDSTTIFVDENPVPVVAGNNTQATTNHYIRIGDGGSARASGYTDWIVVDTTGAYHPGQGAAIPAELSTETGGELKPGFGKKIVFITDPSIIGPDGNYADSGYVADLTQEGFEVVVPNYSLVGTQDAALKTLVDGSDLVIIGRGANSTQFSGGLELYWEKLQKPIILMSNLIARSTKARWLPSAAMINVARFGDLEGKVMNPQDPAFSGVAVPAADSVITFASDNIGMLNLTSALVERTSGEVLISLANGPEAYKVSNSANVINDTIQLSDYNGMPLMIRFPPLDSMYTGKADGFVAARPFHYRTYITGGDDNDWDVINNNRKRAYYVHSPAMVSVLVNEILYLVAQEGPNISDDYTLDTLIASVGTFNPEFNPNVTTYTLSVPSGTTSVTFTAPANHAEAVVTGAGAFSSIPGTDTISVKSQAGSIQDYIIVVKFATVVEGNIVPPGIGTLDEYIANANDGDTLMLINDSLYFPISTLEIDKHLVIRAVEYPELPQLLGMPHVINMFGNTNMILMKDGGKLELIGIDLDGYEGSATKIISFNSKNATVEMFINRCRLHDASGDLIGGNKSDTCTVKSFSIRNSFVYNAALHGTYVKDMYGASNNEYKWEDITFWNLGQQLIWGQNLTATASQSYNLNHMTGWNLGTNTTDPKELIGNGDAGSQDIVTLKNSIFADQQNGYSTSLSFTTVNANGADNVITMSNLVLFNCSPVVPRDGSGPTPITNLYTNDPQFANPENEDFTIGNAAYLTAADDGGVIGARYWHPDFVDDFSDVLNPETSINVVKSGVEVVAYPNPFGSEITFSINLQKADDIVITLHDISGRSVKIQNENLTMGGNQVILKTDELEAGTYFYTIQAGETSVSGHILKLK